MYDDDDDDDYTHRKTALSIGQRQKLQLVQAAFPQGDPENISQQSQHVSSLVMTQYRITVTMNVLST